ncbi:hypothetical protein [Tunicatimonas pelagia]|uniref:hypothetical protein n=1 Tax=Tunicatimonas pelagia TaxID=931531 RepID=UPI0026667587|nr:hypothetical protein [Tunicatimonas pelagia]WKN40479.1 hypothetical protein P0M28_15655 [Tunicatimonas pelagia]
MNLAEAKIAFLKEGVNGLHEVFKAVSTNLDAFIDVYNETQQQNRAAEPPRRTVRSVSSD